MRRQRGLGLLQERRAGHIWMSMQHFPSCRRAQLHGICSRNQKICSMYTESDLWSLSVTQNLIGYKKTLKSCTIWNRREKKVSWVLGKKKQIENNDTEKSRGFHEHRCHIRVHLIGFLFFQKSARLILEFRKFTTKMHNQTVTNEARTRGNLQQSNSKNGGARWKGETEQNICGHCGINAHTLRQRKETEVWTESLTRIGKQHYKVITNKNKGVGGKKC